MNCLPVTARLNPLSFEPPKFHAVGVGSTLLDAVRVAGVDDDLAPFVVVAINGERVPDLYWWRYIRPKDGSCITISAWPMGGSVKRIATIVAAVAVIAGAALITGGVLGPAAAGTIGTGLLGPAFAAGGIGATLAAAGFATAGSLAIYAFTPTPSAPQGINSVQNSKALAGVSGNLLARYDYLPAVFGKARVSPPFLAPPHTDMDEGAQTFANAIYGLFGAYEVANIKLNGVPIDDFDGVTYEVRNGRASDPAPVQDFDKSHHEIEPNLRFSIHDRVNDDNELLDQVTPSDATPDWHVFSIPRIGDSGKIYFRILFPLGLVMDGSSPNNGAVAMKFEIRNKGDSVWYKLPEVMFRGQNLSTQEVRAQVTIEPVVSLTAGALSIMATKVPWIAYWHSNDGGTFERDAEAVYDPGGGVWRAQGVRRDGELGFIIEVLQSALDFDSDLEVRVKKGTNFGINNFNTTTYLHNSSAEQAAWYDYWDNAGTFRAPSAQKAGDTCILESVRDYEVAQPFDYNNICSIHVRARGLRIDSLSAEFTTIAAIYKDGNWSTEEATQNPAALMRHALCGPGNSTPPNGIELREDNLAAFYLRCVSEGHQCNFIATALELVDIIKVICAAGYASPSSVFGYGVVMEYDRSAEPVRNVLTPRNSRPLGFRRPFPVLPHAIVAEFFDEDDDYETKDDITVYAPGFDAGNATRIETFIYTGFTDRVKVERRARFDLAQLYQRNSRYVYDVAYEGFLTPRGTLVGIADDVVVKHHGWGLITEVLTSGGNVTGFKLDNQVDLSIGYNDATALDDPFSVPDITNPQNQLAVAVRLDDGSLSVHPITQIALTSTVTLVTPVLNSSQFAVGMVAVTGVYGKEHKRMIVEQVEPSGRGNFRLTLCDEAPAIHDWSPVRAFTDKTVLAGLWFDFTDRSTMFTDVDGTLTVDADNDPIGAIRDKFNGFLATRDAADADRATYRDDGVTKWAEFAGNQSYNVLDALGMFNNVGYVTVIAGVRPDATSGIKTVFYASTNSAANPRLALRCDASELFDLTGRRLDADATATSTGSALSTSVASCISGQWRYATSDLIGEINGVVDINNTTFQTDGNTSPTNSAEVNIGARDDVNDEWDGRLSHVIVLVTSTVIDPDLLDLLTAYVQARLP